MSYLKKLEYEIVLNESFLIVRRCSGCGRKTRFQNAKKFRVNANGNRLDVWLIYQCELCKHTYNLAIYERQNVSSIPKEEYLCFLENDAQLAEKFGKNLQLFRKNKVNVDYGAVNYSFVKRHEIVEDCGDAKKRIVIKIYNSCALRIRPEKQIAEVLGVSKSRVRKMIQQGKIVLEHVSQQFVLGCVYF